MIEIAIVCDRCGAKTSFELERNDLFDWGHGDFDGSTRETSVLDSIRKNADKRWSLTQKFNEMLAMCPECYEVMQSEIRDKVEAYEELDKKKINAKHEMDRARDEWYAQYLKCHEVTFGEGCTWHHRTDGGFDRS